jgi:hypothetical protein
MYESGFWQNFTMTTSKTLYMKNCHQWTQLFAGYSYDLFQHMVWSLWIFKVRIHRWADFGHTGYTGAWSGFLASRWVRLAEVYIQDLKITFSALRHLLKHTFPTPTTTVMAISVQARAELAVCCGIELTNGLTLLAQLWTVVTSSTFC